MLSQKLLLLSTIAEFSDTLKFISESQNLIHALYSREALILAPQG